MSPASIASAGRDELVAEVSALIARLRDGARDEAARDACIARVLAWQRDNVAAYGRIVRQLAAQGGQGDVLPAVPSDVFRFVRVAAHPAEDDARVFRTSGTTSGARGAHTLRDLGLYDAAAQAAARYALFPDVERMRLLILAPSSEELPDSSLSYMLSRFCEWFGLGEPTFVMRQGRLDLDLLCAALDTACARREPVALLGTSFAFVHADDGLGERFFALPPASRIMQTGGFKGRSREVAPDAMRALLVRRYGVGEAFIVSEYGMTELSSQMYETTLREAVLGLPVGPRRLWVPGWVRATPVDAETLVPVAGDAVGILRIDDLANVDTACAIQTADLARRLGDGILLLGRAAGATPRGCSLAVDAVLGDQDGGARES